MEFPEPATALVSILVLMDLAHEYEKSLRIKEECTVSILVLMDLAHESLARSSGISMYLLFQSLF